MYTYMYIYIYIGLTRRYLKTSLMLRSQSSSGEPTSYESRDDLLTAALIPPAAGGGVPQ